MLKGSMSRQMPSQISSPIAIAQHNDDSTRRCNSSSSVSVYAKTTAVGGGGFGAVAAKQMPRRNVVVEGVFYGRDAGALPPGGGAGIRGGRVGGPRGRQTPTLPPPPAVGSPPAPPIASHRIMAWTCAAMPCHVCPGARTDQQDTHHARQRPEGKGCAGRLGWWLVAAGAMQCNAMQCRAERTYTDAYYRCLRTTYATTGDQTSRPAPHRTARILFCSDLLSCPARVLVPCLLTSSLGAASHHHGCPLALATCH
jgi:hypothetical protein